MLVVASATDRRHASARLKVEGQRGRWADSGVNLLRNPCCLYQFPFRWRHGAPGWRQHLTPAASGASRNSGAFGYSADRILEFSL